MNFHTFIRLFICACLLNLISLSGCGENANGDAGSPQPSITLTPTDAKLAGAWVAEKINDKGDRILLTLSSNAQSRNVVLQAIRQDGSTVTVDQGRYTMNGAKVAFDFVTIPDVTSSFTISATQLTLDLDVYYRYQGLPQGSLVGGQVQLTADAANTSVHAQSVAPIVPGEILVKYKDGRFGKIFVPADPSSAALTLQANSLSLSEVVLNELDHQDRWMQKTLQTIDQLKGRQASTSAALSVSLPHSSEIEYAVPNTLLSVQSFSAPTDPLFDQQ